MSNLPLASDTRIEAHKLTLREVLVSLREEKIITKMQYNWLLGQSDSNARKGIHPLVAIAQMNWQSATTPTYPLSLERLTRWLAEKTGLPYLHIDPLKTDFSALTPFVSYAYASRFQILPIRLEAGERLVIASAEPYIYEWLPELEHTLKKTIQRVFANPQDIARYLDEFYKLQYSIKGAGEKERNLNDSLSGVEQLMELGKVSSKTGGEVDAGDQHIVRIVDWLLQYAFEQRASDIHMEPRREQGQIRFRIDGKLHLVHEVPGVIMTAMVSRLKLLGRMNLAERRRPQDGRIKTLTPDTGRNVELRLSTMPTAFGEKLVMRIFDPEILVRDFKALGLSLRERKLWINIIGKPHGVVLVTGPTGSGKTSTLYSTLRFIHKPELNICSIEDPIEIMDDRFNQMQVNHTIDVDFASGVRTLLRQDPDIIMVGEIRDMETAEVSMQAALTGHLVLSTLHTNDAPSAITRLLNLGLPAYLLNASLLAIVAQRLVRTLCLHCKKPVAPDPAKWQSLIAPHNAPLPKRIYEAGGCDDCRHTGFSGRIGLFELLTITPSLKMAINDNTNLQQLENLALKEGMRPLRLDGATKIAAGVTTFEEVFGVVKLAD
ncbi:GspE/PulE family protein [Candidatus Venteria ishoeyi]|uniref:Type II secretion system protein E n=1 Tax=Candidatus Venteria ishoeyi TaxID=1899563 RepID=A0A1H6FGD7_9GAMM|nr:GspE/PulE family protein [Candidatus Venteria ishoeyi]MDM8546485.1 GspE/PulE family protein [Candidatus Venteria ishoeyi]SEH08064.1 Type II secretion system protein E [Candidatus Venteria ishoeyi]